VRDRLHDLDTDDATVDLVVVTFTDQVERLAAHRRHLGLTTPVVADPDRLLYRSIGADRGRLRDVWSPGTISSYATLIRRGRRLRRPTEDTRQLGADLVVDRSGTIRAVWLPSGPDHRPTPDQIVDAVRAIG
jgi:peroxiredoxin